MKKHQLMSYSINQHYERVRLEQAEDDAFDTDEGCRGERIAPSLGADAEAYIEDMARARMVPRDFVLASALPSISIGCGSKVVVNSRGYRTPVNICVVVVAPSGTNKSYPARETFRPLARFNSDLFEAYQQRLAEARQKHPKADPSVIAATVPRQQLIISDTTPEARNQALRDNPHGLLMYTDEFVTILSNLERNGSPAEFAQLMSIIDGCDLQINRKSEPMVLVKNPFLSIFGTMQKEIFISTMCSDKYLDSGFTQRFLIFHPTRIPIPEYSSIRPLDPGIKQRWDALLRRIYEAPQAISLTFTPMGEMNYACVYNAYSERAINNDDGDTRLAALASKMRVHVIKLAALCAMSRYGTPEFDGRIHYGDVRWAYELSLRLLDNVQRLLEYGSEMGTLMSKYEVFRQASHYFPRLLDKRVMMELMGISETTARRWIERLRGADDADPQYA